MHDDLKKRSDMGHQGWTRNRREGSKQGENDKGPPGGASGKESTCPAGDARDTGSIPGSGRSPGKGNGYSLQYSCLENLMNRGAGGVAKS